LAKLKLRSFLYAFIHAHLHARPPWFRMVEMALRSPSDFVRVWFLVLSGCVCF
jgi:hypothetical protein